MAQGKRKWVVHSIEWLGGLIAFSIARVIGDVGSSAGFISAIQLVCVLGIVYCAVQATRVKAV
jgi:hypothetical protein